MAIAFNKTKGAAQKANFDSYAYKVGDNKVRLVGDVLPRYVYWIKGQNGKNLPLECLAFNRSKESFDNLEMDWVKNYYPDQKCGWAYAIQCIDLDDGKVKVMNLKKKLFQQILEAASDLGDPTDPDTGWDVFFKRVKTGPNVYNVEYTLQATKCKPRALTEEEKTLIQDLKSMDDLLVRPTADAQKELLEKLVSGDLTEGGLDPDIETEFDVS